jgi:hypothetical protein
MKQKQEAADKKRQEDELRRLTEEASKPKIVKQKFEAIDNTPSIRTN